MSVIIMNGIKSFQSAVFFPCGSALQKGFLIMDRSLSPLRETGILYTELTRKALQISSRAHSGQTDKSGLPYILHPFHIAEQMTTETEICAALLHDVIEDTDMTPEELAAEGFPEDVLRTVALLTRDPELPYLDYIRRLMADPLARKIKLADLRHNSNEARLEDPSAISSEKREEYKKALTLLENQS